MWTFENFVEQSQRLTDIAELKVFFEHAMSEEGFENHFVGTIVDGSIAEIAWAEFPAGHLENYLAEHWDRVDPILEFAARARRPFCWDAVAAQMQFKPAQTALLAECKRIGVHSITVLPIQDPNGHCTIIGVSRRRPEPPDPSRIPVVMAACAQTWWRYSELSGSGLTSHAETSALTSRELEILKWVKHGKNNTQISELTSVSTKTVEYHLGNILKKLDASNRTAAVVIALRNKLLPL